MPDNNSLEECPFCRGARFYRLDVPVGHEQFGKAHPCPVCEIPRQRRARAERLRRLAGVPEDLSRYTFATFQPEWAHGTAGERRELGAILQEAQAYAEDPAGWLVLHGTYGCGKTHLAYAIVERSLALGRSVYYGSLPEVLDTLRAGYDDAAGMAYDARMRTMLDVELLVLDDVGAEHQTAWGNEKLFELTNYRYTRRLPLVVTTNLNVAERPCPLEPRVLSRLNDVRLTTVLALPVGDYRQTCGAAERVEAAG